MNLKEINEAINVAAWHPSPEPWMHDIYNAAVSLKNRLAASHKINIELRRRIRELEADIANHS